MTTPKITFGPDTTGARRYVPLVAWLIAVVALVLIPLKIHQTGYVPGGDARRHVAKAFIDKSNQEILVLVPQYKVDNSVGWEWLLRYAHRKLGWNADALISFSLIGLMLCVFYAPLPWLRRPEAWLAALLAQMLAIPELMVRLTQARPLLLTAAVLIGILFAWSKPDNKGPSWIKLLLTTFGFALSAWMHGQWFLWILPLAAFFLARAWSAAISLTLCWMAGTILGAMMTGKPFDFLEQAIFLARKVSSEGVPKWMLVGELQPSYGEFATLTLIGIVFLWRKIAGKQPFAVFQSPSFWLIVIGWILGLGADRCWADWGVPAVLVWLAMQFEELMVDAWDANAPQRIIACGLLALPLLLHSTNDLDRRYSRAQEEMFLDAADPALQGWLPDHGGILYSSQMGIFYNTFYKNPAADWRYVLGIEPAVMPDDDLKIFRDIQRYPNILGPYEPWIDKMRPADRLAIYSGPQPNLTRLEWHNAGGGIWLGRLRREKKP